MTSGNSYSRSSVNFYKRKFHDREKGTYLGRTPLSWAKIILFYLIFYGVLAAVAAICSWVFLQTLDPRIPKRQMEGSLIGTNPGMGFRPMPRDNQESTTIWLQDANTTNGYQHWYHNLMEFLDPYYTPGKTEKGNVQLRPCSYTNPPTETEVCEVNVKDWGDCSRDRFFNYDRSSPCIFLKLNKIYGWIPHFYDDPAHLPRDMPPELKKHIRNTSPEKRKTIWVSCKGENPADIEYLGEIKYYPDIQGFPGYYFPFRNSEGYLSPLVAIRILKPVQGIVMNVECRAWAKNIKYSRMERTGSVHFELLIG